MESIEFLVGLMHNSLFVIVAKVGKYEGFIGRDLVETQIIGSRVSYH